MKPAIKKRIAGTLAANLFGQMVTVGTQLLSVPLFLSVWGKDLYGEWLVISALPILIGQSCGGFASAGGTEMIVRGRNSKTTALEIYHTSTLITGVIAILLMAAAAVAVLCDVGAHFGFRHLMPREINALLVLFTAQVALNITLGLVVAGFRAAELFARGFLWHHITRLGSFIAGAVVLLAGGRPASVAGAMLCGQTSIALVAFVVMRAQVPWLAPGIKMGSRAEFFRILMPSLADTAYPFAVALRAQSMVVVLGFAASPGAAAVFASLRTLASTVLQLSRFVYIAVQQEMSVAFSNRDFSLLRRMHSQLLKLTACASAAASIAMLLFGRPLFSYWTKGALLYSAPTFALLLLSTSIGALAMVNATLLRALNRHGGISLFMLCVFAVAVIPAIPISAEFGALGAALCLLVAEGIVLAYGATQCQLLVRHGAGVGIATDSSPAQSIEQSSAKGICGPSGDAVVKNPT